jgi:hypothetical protein
MNYKSHLTIAGIDFDIGSDIEIDDSQLPAAYSEFSGFFTGESERSVSVELVAGALKDVSKLERCFDAGDMWSLFRDGQTRYIVHTGGGIETPMWAAEMDLGVSAIRVYCGSELQKSGSGGRRSEVGDRGAAIFNPMRYPLDQILMTYLLSQRGGVLLHSAGVLCNGRLWLLAGKSGAGKSTSARLLMRRGGVELVSDDRIIVRRIDGDYVAYGTPWPGEAKIAVNRMAPLGGILFLDQSPVNQIDEISAVEAFERMMPVASIPWYEPELFSAAMDFCGSLAGSLPMYVLKFRPDAEAAEMISNFLCGFDAVNEGSKYEIKE